ncbi:uncharacterized protein LOC102805837 [Saccoglossus kowalevskii]
MGKKAERRSFCADAKLSTDTKHGSKPPTPEVEVIGIDVEKEHRKAKNKIQINVNGEIYWKHTGALNTREKKRQQVVERSMERELKQTGVRLDRYTDTLKQELQEFEAQKRLMKRHPAAGYSYRDDNKLYQRNMLDRYGTRGRYLFSVQHELRKQRQYIDADQKKKDATKKIVLRDIKRRSFSDDSKRKEELPRMTRPPHLPKLTEVPNKPSPLRLNGVALSTRKHPSRGSKTLPPL